MVGFSYPDIYTCEIEPRGAKKWVPLTKDGILIKSNVKKVLAGKPAWCWVYEQVAMDHLAEFDWPWTRLRYDSAKVVPMGRWKETRSFTPGRDDF